MLADASGALYGVGGLIAGLVALAGALGNGYRIRQQRKTKADATSIEGFAKLVGALETRVSNSEAERAKCEAERDAMAEQLRQHRTQLDHLTQDLGKVQGKLNE